MDVGKGKFKLLCLCVNQFCIKNWFNLVHGVFWVRCTVEKTADFLDKTGRPRSQNQNAFILCDSLFVTEIESNWLVVSFGARRTFEEMDTF